MRTMVVYAKGGAGQRTEKGPLWSAWGKGRGEMQYPGRAAEGAANHPGAGRLEAPDASET